ncbi:NUDIX hydrolase [Olivibacter sitiensis]|uniref:NUDIX hydrolase n=1 Tax=Olivibacter sitiensis TaxID=376470 RepID=UPI00068753E5|nr:CoA pyrophosphatase [Olivibacter sitiensis]
MTFNDSEKFIAWLSCRLNKPLPGFEAQSKMIIKSEASKRANIPKEARESAVMLLLYPQGGELFTTMIERSSDGGVHSGQIAFPGGKREESDADLIATALREANEEVNFKREQAELLGFLSPIYIPVSYFKVQTVVMASGEAPELRASEWEVASILEVPLLRLFEHKVITSVQPSLNPTLKWKVPAYQTEGGHIIWGATAMILSELEALWREWLIL